MHGPCKQTLCHPADRSVDWRNTGNGGLCWNPEPTLEPGEVTFAPHDGALRLLIRLIGDACGNRPRAIKSIRAGPGMSKRRMGPPEALYKRCSNSVPIQGLMGLLSANCFALPFTGSPERLAAARDPSPEGGIRRRLNAAGSSQMMLGGLRETVSLF